MSGFGEATGAEAADEELPGVVERYAAHGLHSLGYVGKAFCTDFSRADIFYGLGGHLAVVDKNTDRLGVLAGHDYNRFECFGLEFHVQVKCQFLALPKLNCL